MGQQTATRTSNQAALDEFAGQSDPLADADLPERAFSWADESTEGRGGLTLVPPDDAVSLKRGYLDKGDAAFVLGDADAYIDRVGDRQIEMPRSYSTFDEFDPYVGMVTTLSSGYGVGISSLQLEAGLRFATGGGRYTADEITVIGCKDKPFVVRAPDGDFQIAPAQVSRPEDYEGPRANVMGITIEEGDNRVIEGLKQLLTDARVLLDTEPTEYRGLTTHSHRIAFSNDDADHRRVSGSDCEQHRRLETSPEAVLGSIEIDRVG